jgi:hypothetical protein
VGNITDAPPVGELVDRLEREYHAARAPRDRGAVTFRTAAAPGRVDLPGRVQAESRR